MVVVMQEGATEDQIQRAINKLMEMGVRYSPLHRSTSNGPGRGRRPSRF